MSATNVVALSAPTRLIKKYANRRLYDVRTSSYITHKDICDYLREGDVVQVMDNDTRSDITHEVLLGVLVSVETQRRGEARAQLLETEAIMTLLRCK